MPLASSVQTSVAGRTCPDCHATIDPSRRYCDRDRDRRRALTFLEQAERVLNPSDRIIAFVSARNHVRAAIEELAR